MKIKTLLVISILMLFSSFLLMGGRTYVWADDDDDNGSEKIEDLQDDIEKYEEKMILL